MRSNNKVKDNSKREVIEAQALNLREYVIEAIERKTGVKCPKTMTLDQLVRTAAANGIGLHFYSSSIAMPEPTKYMK